jgi:cysteine desulfurase/selenocysteine lyase
VRDKVLQFTGANPRDYDVIYTSGATDGLNMISHMINVKPGDNVVISRAEHHANIVPWQQLGCELRYLDLGETGELKLEQLDDLIDEQTCAVSLTGASNVVGRATNWTRVMKLVKAAQKRLGHHVTTVMDAAQLVAHAPLEISSLGVDYIAFSAHKMYAPMGLGILLGRRELLEQATPPKTGGGIVELVEEQQTSFLPSPNKFEPGTYNVAGIAGLGAAIDYLQQIGWGKVTAHEQELTAQLLSLGEIPQVHILGEPKLGVVSFTVDDIHPHDLGQILDEAGVAARVGHHCAQLIHRRFGVASSTRASLGIYNEPEDINQLIEGVKEAVKFFAR